MRNDGLAISFRTTAIPLRGLYERSTKCIDIIFLKRRVPDQNSLLKIELAELFYDLLFLVFFY